MADYYNYDGKPVDEEDLTDAIDEELIDVSGMVLIGQLSYEPGRVLREVDETAWREVLNEFIDYRLWNSGDGEGNVGMEDLLFEDEDDVREYRREYLGEEDDE